MSQWATQFDRVPRWLRASEVSDGAIRLWCALHELCMQEDGAICHVQYQTLMAGPPKRSERFIRDRLHELKVANAVTWERTRDGIVVTLQPDGRPPDRHSDAGQTGTHTPDSAAQPRRTDRRDGAGHGGTIGGSGLTSLPSREVTDTAGARGPADNSNGNGNNAHLLDLETLPDRIHQKTGGRPIPAVYRHGFGLAVASAMRAMADITVAGIEDGICWLREHGNHWQQEKSTQWSYLSDRTGRHLIALLECVEAAGRMASKGAG